jgi:hypothetical protein
VEGTLTACCFPNEGRVFTRGMYLILQLRRRLHIRPLFELCAAATARFQGAGERGIYVDSLLYRGNVGHWSVSRYAQTGPCCGWLTTLHRGGRANVLISRGFFFAPANFSSQWRRARETHTEFCSKATLRETNKKQISCIFREAELFCCQTPHGKFSTRFYQPPHIGAKRELFRSLCIHSKLSDFVSQVHVRGSALVKGGDPLGHDIIASAPLSLAGWRGERRAFVKNPGKPRRKRSGMILGNLREPQRRRGGKWVNCNGEKPWGKNIARKFAAPI